jgi:serine/threonine protein kinase
MRYLFRYDQLAPRGLDGPYSPQLKDLVRLCLERQPQRRPSAHELLRHPFLAADVGRGRASPTRPTN